MNYKRIPPTRHVLLAAVAACLALPAAAVPGDAADLAFSAARDAFRKGERVRLGRQVEALRGHPLQAWAEYWVQRLRLDEGDSSGVTDYLAR